MGRPRRRAKLLGQPQSRRCVPNTTVARKRLRIGVVRTDLAVCICAPTANRAVIQPRTSMRTANGKLARAGRAVTGRGVRCSVSAAANRQNLNDRERTELTEPTQPLGRLRMMNETHGYPAPGTSLASSSSMITGLPTFESPHHFCGGVERLVRLAAAELA